MFLGTTQLPASSYLMGSMTKPTAVNPSVWRSQPALSCRAPLHCWGQAQAWVRPTYSGTTIPARLPRATACTHLRGLMLALPLVAGDNVLCR